MPRRRLIASLLLSGGRLVKGVRFADYREAGDPAAIARAYTAQGIDELILADIDAGRERRGPDIAAVAAVAGVSTVPLTIGGGITGRDVARSCIERGADKVLLTTAALDRPDLIDELAQLFGSQAVIAGIDLVETERGYRLYDHRTGKLSERSSWQSWLSETVDRGAGEIRLASVSREGRRAGLDLALYAEASARVRVPIILEGGAGTLPDLDAALAAGVEAIALGTMLTFSDNNIFKLKQYLGDRGHAVRRLSAA